MATRSVSGEADDILLATDMIRLGARLQVLQAETSLSYERLARLYREVRGDSPPKGMLPFSVDWFTTWLPNIHSTIFYSIYCYMRYRVHMPKGPAMVQAYRLYLEQAAAGRLEGASEEPVLSFTRAWVLLRFFESEMLQFVQCTSCSGEFVAHAHEPANDFICGICKPPPRAGKTRASRALHKKKRRAKNKKAD